MSIERIEVTLGKSGGAKVFETLQELEIWLSKERESWSWLTNQPVTEAQQVVWQRYGSFLDSIQSQLNEAKRIKQHSLNGNENPNYAYCFDIIRKQFITTFDQQRCQPSNSPFTKFIESLRGTENNAVAAAAMAFSMRCPISINQHDALRGAIYCLQFESGVLERKPQELQTLEDLRLEWEGKFQTFREALIAETDKHKKLNIDGSQLISKHENAFQQILLKQEDELKSLVSSAKTEWNDLRKTYDNSLALRSPVTYWTRKATTHKWLAWAYVVATIIVAWASIYILVQEVKDMLIVPKGIKDPESWHPEYWRLAILVTSGLFCVWVIRILVRLLLSNVHLLTDAKERVTMVQTYLALLRRDKLKDEERMFILQTLFRPTPTGIVKDDAVPLTIVEGLTKIGK